MICDLAEFRKKVEGKNITITEIKVKLEEAPRRLTTAENTVRNIEDRSRR